MIKQLLLIAAACLPFICAGQKKPLILKGRFENPPEKELYVFFYTPQAYWVKDTIRINESGDFFFETYKCEIPQKIDIQNNRFQINGMLVAPGYEMSISGDAKDGQTLWQTITFSGTGACVNNYREAHTSVSPLSQFDSTILKNGIKLQEQETDSILNMVFDNCSDPYSAWFKKLERNEILFANYARILNYAAKARYDTKTYLGFINNNIPDSIMKFPGKEEYLLSERYRYFLRTYSSYLIQLVNRADSNLIKNDKSFILKKIAGIVSGDVRDYILYTGYSDAIEASLNQEDLKQSYLMYDTVINNYTSTATQQILQKEYADKIAFFQATNAGMPAPGFTLPDQNDLKHSLSDYLGKVVYIDFWASWCGPCRAENPELKQLYQNFRNNKNLVIIGVAVRDSKTNWLRAIDEDGPEWLQLRDENNKLTDLYNLNAIPRFAIIDKKGNIVTIDAPRPSEKKALFNILTKELAK